MPESFSGVFSLWKTIPFAGASANHVANCGVLREVFKGGLRENNFTYPSFPPKFGASTHSVELRRVDTSHCPHVVLFDQSLSPFEMFGMHPSISLTNQNRRQVRQALS